MKDKLLTAPVINHLFAYLQNQRLDILESNLLSTFEIKGTNLHNKRTFISLMVYNKFMLNLHEEESCLDLEVKHNHYNISLDAMEATRSSGSIGKKNSY